MNITIIGAGAIGGWIGAKLALAGHDVNVLARGATLDAIRASGLRLREGESEHAAHVFASDSAAKIAAHGAQDAVVIAVKSHALASVVTSIELLCSPNTMLISAMNGVPPWFFARSDRPLYGTALSSLDPYGAIAKSMPAERVIGCVVHASCSVDAPGAIRHKFGQRLFFGEARGGESARLAALVDTFNRAGFEAIPSADIQRDIWFKLWGNMTMNPISAITGATADRVLDDDCVRAFITRAMDEAKTIGAAIGIPIAETPADRHAVTRKLGAFKTSMLQDVEAGKAIELDALVNAVREIGAKVNVATPNIDALYGITRLFARSRNLY